MKTLNQSFEPEQRDSDDLHLAVIFLETFEAEQRDSDDLHLAVILLARRSGDSHPAFHSLLFGASNILE